MSVIELRGHHLGAIYNVVALAGGEIESKKVVRKAITEFACKLARSEYPPTTVNETSQLLEEIFLSQCCVEIVSGLDRICTSGCIQRLEGKLLDNSLDCLKRDNLRKSLAFFCQNNEPHDDKIMIIVFQVVIGKKYSCRELTRKAYELWRKGKFQDWNDLVELYRKENEAECQQFIKADLELMQ